MHKAHVALGLAAALTVFSSPAMAQFTIDGGGGTTIVINSGPIGSGPIPGVAYRPSYGYSTTPTPRQRRPATQPCTEVVLEGLPASAEVDVMVAFSYLGDISKPIDPQEEAVIVACHSLNVGAGATPAQVDPAEGSVDNRLVRLVYDQDIGVELKRRPEVAVLQGLSRLSVRANQRGVARIFIPRENEQLGPGLLRGFTMGSLAFEVRATDGAAQRSVRSSGVLVPSALVASKNRVTFNVRRPNLGDINWSDDDGAAMTWNGRQFTLAQGR